MDSPVRRIGIRRNDGSKDIYPLILLKSLIYNGRSGKHWGFERAFVVSELPLRDETDRQQRHLTPIPR